MAHIDTRALRDGFGEFVTGVTIITTRDGEGEPAGLTANSFSSLSLDPPLVMFALGKTSNSFEAFDTENGFVIHVLAEEHKDLSVRFSAKGIDRFEGVDWSPGHDDLPVIAGALATFECSREHVYEGGDHLIMVGRIERFSVGGRTRPSLGYFRSRYVAMS